MLQLLGGCEGCVVFLWCALLYLWLGGLLVVMVVDVMDCFDDEHVVLLLLDVFEVVGVLYASQLLRVVEDGGCAVIHCCWEIVGGGGLVWIEDVVVRLDRVLVDEVDVEAAWLGFVVELQCQVFEIECYFGSTIVVL